MSNALKFTPPHGTVTIALKASHLDNAEEMESDQSLTQEEAVLLTKYRTEDFPCSVAAGEGDVDVHSDTAFYKEDSVIAAIHRDPSAHEDDVDVHRDAAAIYRDPSAHEDDVDIHRALSAHEEDVDIHKDASAHEEDAERKKSEAHDDTERVIVDGKEYKKFGIGIASFVDTGAGISKVRHLYLPLFGVHKMLLYITNDICAWLDVFCAPGKSVKSL